MTSSPPTPRIAAPRISLVSASTTTFMKPCVSPFSTARPTLVIGRLPTNAFRPDSRTWSTVMPGPAQRRVDVERVGGHAVADLAGVVVEQIGGDDLEVVVRGVGECAACRCSRPSPRCASTLVRHWSSTIDVAAGIGLHTRVLEAEVVGVGLPSDRDQQVRTGDRVGAVARCHLETVVALAEPNGRRVEFDRRCPRSRGSP